MTYDLLPEGQYDFFIKYCDVDYISKKNNACIKIVFKIMHLDKEYTVWDYILKSNAPGTEAPWEFLQDKVDDLFLSIGKSLVMINDVVNKDLAGCTGSAFIRQDIPEKLKGDDDSAPEYPPGNKIGKYCPAPKEETSVHTSEKQVQEELNELDEDIPF